MKLHSMDRNELALASLRYAVGGVFLWFGVDKFIHPEAWLGWAPGWLLDVVALESPLMLTLQGFVESLIGLALVAGVFVRPAALLATLMLAMIGLLIGWNETTIRDVGLLGASLALLSLSDGQGKRSIGTKRLATLIGVYVLIVFFGGVMFLKG